MKIKVFPRYLLESKWNSDKAQFDDPGTPPPNCLRCGKPLDSDFYHNKLCRYIPVTICCSCGDDEALRCNAGKMLPFEQWHAVTHGVIDASKNPHTAFLTPVCTFKHVFEKQKSASAAALSTQRAWLRTPVPITTDTDGTPPGLMVPQDALMRN